MALAVWAAPGPDVAPRLALEVLNPASAGRKILHFDDVIGPQARKVGPYEKAKAMMVYATSVACAIPDEKRPDPPCADDLTQLDSLAAKVRPQGVMVVGLVMVDKRDDADGARKAFGTDRRGLVFTVDTHGLARQSLSITRNRQTLVIRSDGRIVGRYDGVDSAEKKILELIEEDR